MTFFNKREDVIKIELTPHGRKLISEGKFMPSYYAFFDDDILYDSQRGGFSEINSETKTRILTQTLSLRPQTNYKGVESKTSDRRSYETGNHLLTPIGTNKIEETKTNGWNVTFLHNTASSTSNYLSSAGALTLQIPQIESTIEYKMKQKKGPGQPSPSLNMLDSMLWDVGDIEIEEQQILINILENNGFNYNESLELEVFLYEQDQQTYNKLEFQKKESSVINDVFVEKNSIFDVEEGIWPSIGPEMVEYWIRLNVDNEISNADRCSGLKSLNSRDIYLDVELECPDLEGTMTNIYATSVDELEDCEE